MKIDLSEIRLVTQEDLDDCLAYVVYISQTAGPRGSVFSDSLKALQALLEDMGAEHEPEQ